MSDSSESKLQAHVGRLNPQGLGVVGNHRDIGFFIHPSLVLDAQSNFPLGISALHLWTRAFEPADQQRHAVPVPIAAKESYKWLG